MRNASGFAELSEGRVYYEVAGEGDPIVFLHTAFLDSRMWDDQWREFSRRHTVVRFDMRGFGKSDGLQKPVSRRQELYRVLEATGVSRATLVGCSLGGETALDVAVEHPELVSALVVVSAVPGGFELQGEPPKDLMDMLAAVEQGDLERASELQMRIWIDGPFRRPEQVDPHVRWWAAELNRAALASGEWLVSMAPVPDLLDPPAAQRLNCIEAPTLIVVGALDHPEILRAADVMAAAISGATKAVIHDTAHTLNLEKPAEFGRLIEDFLRTQAG